jgi:hypothetical protein
LQRLGGRLQHGRDEQLQVDGPEVALLDPGHRRDLAVRASHVLGDQAPDAADRFPPPLCRPGGGPTHVLLGYPALRPRGVDVGKVDSELLRDLPDQGRRAES